MNKFFQKVFLNLHSFELKKIESLRGILLRIIIILQYYQY
jgi:hypothetical protein